jgi:hypothetical protein
MAQGIDRNLVTFRVEMQVGYLVARPSSFVNLTGSVV